jgi:hypothetical protein
LPNNPKDGKQNGFDALMGKELFRIPVGNDGRGTPVNVLGGIGIVIFLFMLGSALL